MRVKGIVPSGVIAYVEGIRGFIPASHLSLDYVEDCNPWLGKDLDVRVITVDEICQKRIKKPGEVLSVGQSVKAKILNTNDNKISLSIRALEDEMVDTKADEIENVEEYISNEEASTSLGSLLAGFKFE